MDCCKDLGNPHSFHYKYPKEKNELPEPNHYFKALVAAVHQQNLDVWYIPSVSSILDAFSVRKRMIDTSNFQPNS